MDECVVQGEREGGVVVGSSLECSFVCCFFQQCIAVFVLFDAFMIVLVMVVVTICGI